MSSPSIALPPGATLVSGPQPSSSPIALPPGARLVTPTDPPAIQQPEGSGASRFFGAVWDAGKNFAKVLGDLADAGGVPTHPTQGPDVIPGTELYKDIKGIVQAHMAQAQKAQDAFNRGDYVEAFGHTLATVAPLVGPAAAHAAERMGGTAPVFDKYGNVVTPGKAPDIWGGAGEAFSLLAPLGVIEGVRALRGGGAPETPPGPPAPSAPPPAGGAPAAPRSSGGGLIPSSLNPVEQAAADFLESRGVPLDAATRTGNRFVKGASVLVKNQPLGASTAMRAAQATEQGLTRVAGELSDEAHPTPVTPESAGQAVPRVLNSKIQDLGLQEDAAYAKAWTARNDPAHTYEMPVKTEPVIGEDGKPTGETEQTMARVNMPVDVRDIKVQLKPVWEEMQWMPAADRASSAGYQAVKNILDGDDFIPAWQAEKGLSGLKTMARTTNKTGVRNASQGIAAGVIPDLQANIDAAVAYTGEDAIRGLQQGRAFHAGKMEVADLAEQLRDEPVQTFNQLTWRNDTGIDFLRKIADQAPDTMSQIGRAFIQKLFDQATREGGFGRTRTIQNEWQNLGPQTKSLLYPDPQLRSSLDNFFQGAKMFADNPNPSGTAVVGSLIPGGLLMIHNPLTGGAWLLGGYAASKLLFSPRGVALLTGGLKPGSAAGAGWTASQIMKAAGGDDVTPLDMGGPGGGAPPASGGAAAPLTPPGGAPPPAGQGGLSQGFQNAADAALQRMRDRGTFNGTRAPSMPVDDLADMAIWGAAKIAQGVTKQGAWAKAMLADFGDSVKPYLDKMWGNAQKIYDRNVANTEGDLPNTKQLLKLVQQGDAGKDWYTHTHDELVDMFGEKDAPMMEKFLAATSPNNTVAANVTQALKAYRQWRAGEPFQGFLPPHIDGLNAAVAGEDFGGLKVHSFLANLEGDPEAVTVDRWIRRAFGFKAASITDPQYKFMDYTLTHIAQRVGMEPRQVQASIWTAIKEAEQRATGNTSEPFEALLPKKLAADPQMQELIQRSKAGELPPPRP